MSLIVPRDHGESRRVSSAELAIAIVHEPFVVSSKAKAKVSLSSRLGDLNGAPEVSLNLWTTLLEAVGVRHSVEMHATKIDVLHFS